MKGIYLSHTQFCFYSFRDLWSNIIRQSEKFILDKDKIILRRSTLPEKIMEKREKVKKAVMGINALIVNPLITDLIFSLARYFVKLFVNVSGLTLTKLKS